MQGGQKYRHEFEFPTFNRSPVGTGGPHSAQHLRIPLGTRATTGVGGGGTTGAEAAWVVAGEVPDASVTGGTTGTSSPTVEVAMARVGECEKQVRFEVSGSSFLELVASCTRKSIEFTLSEQNIAQHNAGVTVCTNTVKASVESMRGDSHT